jgi:hypothetical protein
MKTEDENKDVCWARTILQAYIHKLPGTSIHIPNHVVPASDRKKYNAALITADPPHKKVNLEIIDI